MDDFTMEQRESVHEILDLAARAFRPGLVLVRYGSGWALRAPAFDHPVAVVEHPHGLAALKAALLEILEEPHTREVAGLTHAQALVTYHQEAWMEGWTAGYRAAIEDGPAWDMREVPSPPESKTPSEAMEARIEQLKQSLRDETTMELRLGRRLRNIESTLQALLEWAQKRDGK